MTAVVESVSTLAQDPAATDHVISKPAGTVEGDLLELTGSIDQGQTVTLPAGFADNITVNELNGSIGGGAAVRLSKSWKIAGASEPADYTAVVGAAVEGAWVLRRISNFNAANPIDVIATPTTGTDDTAETPTPTTTEDDVLVLLDVGTGGGRTITPPGGAVTADWNENPSTCVGVGGHKTQASAGVVGSETYDWSAEAGINWIASAVGIKPAAAGPSMVILRRRMEGY